MNSAYIKMVKKGKRRALIVDSIGYLICSVVAGAVVFSFWAITVLLFSL